jgi:hypothetical protein
MSLFANNGGFPRPYQSQRNLGGLEEGKVSSQDGCDAKKGAAIKSNKAESVSSMGQEKRNATGEKQRYSRFL